MVPPNNRVNAPHVGRQGNEEMNDTMLNEPVGLDGWLVLVGLGMVLSPLGRLVSFAKSLAPFYQDGVWAALTTPGSDAYHPVWAPVILFEAFGNLGFLLAYVALFVLFFRRSAMFPRLFIWTAVLNFPYIVIDTWLSSYVVTDQAVFDPATVKRFVGATGTNCHLGSLHAHVGSR
jgi:hypothetical protein